MHNTITLDQYTTVLKQLEVYLAIVFCLIKCAVFFKRVTTKYRHGGCVARLCYLCTSNLVTMSVWPVTR